MDLRPYVENIQHQLVVAADAGGDDARALADRLVAPLDAALRLAFQDVLAAATEEITTEFAPGSVELRLRGRNPEFVVTLPPEGDADPGRRPTIDADEGPMSRINLRMPDQLKAQIEQAASSEGVSVNTWLVRAAAAALQSDTRRAPQSGQSYKGWAR